MLLVGNTCIILNNYVGGVNIVGNGNILLG